MSTNAGITLEHYYDFFNEDHIVYLIAGFVAIKRGIYKYVQLSSLAFEILHKAFLATMAIITIVVTDYDKEIVVKLVHTLSILFGAVAIQIQILFERDDYILARTQLKRGVFLYEEILDEQKDILKKRLKVVRILNWLVFHTIYGCGVIFALCIPLYQLLPVATFDDHDGLLNRYLALPIHMPFNTRAPMGYAVAFISQSLFYFLTLSVYVCNGEMIVGGSLQVCAQFDVLKYSIDNIQRRALQKYLNATGHEIHKSQEDLFHIPEYQQFLYLCLRENVIHHLEILRLMKHVQGYLNASFRMCLLLFSIIIAAAIKLFLEDSNNVILIVIVVSDLLGFIQVCYLGQFLTNKSETIKFALYSMPWYECNKDFKVLLKVMLENNQKPLHIIAMRVVCSMESFSDTCSLSYKILNVLR